MKKLVLAIRNKRDLDQLLLELQRLNIRIISYGGTVSRAGSIRKNISRENSLALDKPSWHSARRALKEKTKGTTQIADATQQITSESSNIPPTRPGKRFKISDQETQKQRIEGYETKQKPTTTSGKSPRKDKVISMPEAKQPGVFQWKFSNHVFSGVENKTFSREEIYEDAEWEKNIH